MRVTEVNYNWLPTGFHGSIPYVEGVEVAVLIEQAIKQATKRIPATQRPVMDEAQYLIETRSDGTRTLVFEITS